MFQRFKSLRTAVLSVALIGPYLMASSCMTSDEIITMVSEPTTAATVKPGAGVTMNYEAPQNLGVGQYGVLKLNFSEFYNAGTLRLEARPEEGLRLISEVAEKEISLASGNVHEWELDVTSNKDGIYYVSIFARVKTPEGSDDSRAFSARVDVGDITKAGAHKSRAQNGILSQDGKSVILEAEEIIR